jgi:hypothetical protein
MMDVHVRYYNFQELISSTLFIVFNVTDTTFRKRDATLSPRPKVICLDCRFKFTAVHSISAIWAQGAWVYLGLEIEPSFRRVVWKKKDNEWLPDN